MHPYFYTEWVFFQYKHNTGRSRPYLAGPSAHAYPSLFNHKWHQYPANNDETPHYDTSNMFDASHLRYLTTNGINAQPAMTRHHTATPPHIRCQPPPARRDDP
uniref:Uncharacterized protein n=1 Tax=Arundo donax TaxID=35708 RepID=A0A0A9D6H4_ARUDO